DGSAYRASVTIEPNAGGRLSVGDLAGFPAGKVYSVRYDSDMPVALSLPTNAFGEAIGSSFSDVSYTQWLFGEGFRPPTELADSVDEYIRVYNPNASDVVIEITIRYDNNGGLEVFRRAVSAREVAEFDVHTFITGSHRDEYSYYGITVKAASPIVAYMGHYDAFFPGAFGTLGTPLGNARADI
ncbi:MAG: hypothetical protein KDA28_10160, partial [Phycisphaerales bacterium]|nr:hypothetical protein [Phycisphaerales bacterium]